LYIKPYLKQESRLRNLLKIIKINYKLPHFAYMGTQIKQSKQSNLREVRKVINNNKVESKQYWNLCLLLIVSVLWSN